MKLHNSIRYPRYSGRTFNYFDDKNFPDVVRVPLFDIGFESSFPVLVSAAHQAINILSHSLASMPIQIINGRGNVRPGHPMMRVFNNPNPIMGPYQTRKKIYESFIGLGNGFAVIGRTGPGARFVGSITPADLEEASWDTSGTIPSQVYKLKMPGEQQYEEYTRDEVIHFAGNFYDGLTAKSPLDAVNLTIQNVQEAMGVFFEALKKLSLTRDFFEVEESVTAGLTPDQVNEFYDSLGRNVAKNAGKDSAVFLPTGVKYSGGAQGAAIDQTILEYLTHAIEDIARIFNLPPRYLGVTRNVRVSNELSEMSEDLFRISLMPHVRVVEEELTKLLFEDEIARGYKVKLDVTEARKGSRENRFEVANSAYAGAVLTRKEAREYIGDLPEREGDDEYIASVPGAAPGTEETRNNEENSEEIEQN